MKPLLPAVLCTLFPAFVLAEDVDEPPAFSVLKADGRLVVKEGERPVLVYQQAPESRDGRFTRANYVHPLHGLDGEVLTEDFPDDHPHHRGVFWAWHQLYAGDERLGDSWSTRDFTYDVTSAEVVEERGPNSVGLTAKVQWKSSKLVNDAGEPVPVVSETTRIRVHARTEHAQEIDFTIGLRALLPDVRLGGSDDDKGYGGFSVRVKLPDDLRFLGPDGPVQPQRTAVKVGPWTNFVADDWGIAVLTHPKNPAPRDEWILRRRRAMQNPVFPGREPVAVPQDEPLVLQYRLVVHDGTLDAAAVEKLQAGFDRGAENDAR